MSTDTTPADNPPHPLVVDGATGLCRLVTQEDITRFERMSNAYEALMRELRDLAGKNALLMERIENGR